MKKLIAGVIVATFACVAANAYAGGHNMRKEGEGKEKKHGKKQPTADKAEDKGAAPADKKDEPKK
jgi:hypothetical protein